MEEPNNTKSSPPQDHHPPNRSNDFQPDVEECAISLPHNVGYLEALHNEKFKRSLHSDQESDGSSSECATKKCKHRLKSVSRRLSIHRDMLLQHRKLNRAGSEKRKMSDKMNSLKPLNLFASLDCAQTLTKSKNLHLGHSAPNINYFFTNEKPAQKRSSCVKSGSSSFCASQASGKKSRPFFLKGSPKISQIKSSRRISINSLLSDWSSFPSPSSAFSSRHSSQEGLEIDSAWDEQCCDEQQQRNFASPSSPFRPRARSFNQRYQEPDSNLNALNEFYRNRFPKAITDMELKLERFMEKCRCPEFETSIKSDGSASFILHQLMELAGDCLERSRIQQISSSYFSELVSSMQQLIENAKSKFHCNDLGLMIRELLMIISRPARLLECLEFDPKDYYKKLEQGDIKQIHNADVITYILKKLRLDKNFDKDSKNDDGSSDTSSNTSSSKEAFRSPGPTTRELQLPKNENINDNINLFLRPPQEVDFETVKLVSNGAYGAVLLVRHRETRKLFAMKKLLKSDLVLRNMIDQVFAERDILTFTDNPFVVSFYCSFETKKHLCMVLEYVEGGDCAALLKNIGGPLPLDMSRLYFAETVMALEYLHSFGVVHRDLKPDNLLLTSTGHIKLTDFGLSKIGLMKMTTNLFEGSNLDCSQFLDNQVFGTPEYIAPEVILRQGYGQTVDWWSMGVILYQFLVGCVPFTGDTTEEVFSEIVSGEIVWPEEEEYEVCEEAQDIIDSLLERDPVNRLGYAGAMEVKDHVFFEDVDWSGLLRQKTQFVPQLADEEDTSYFDVRLDRFCHRTEDSDEEESEKNDLFRSFSTCSPRYSRTDVMLFSDKVQDIGEKGEEMPRIEMGHDWTDMPRYDMDGSFNAGSIEEASNNKTLPSRLDNKSCSSLNETCLQMEKDQLASKGKGLRPTRSLKRYREDRVVKSSSSAALGNNNNSTPIKNKIPLRLVRQFSRDSSGGSFDDSFHESLPKVVQVARGKEGFGFSFRTLKVLSEATSKYTLQHVIVLIEKNGPAHLAGLCVGDVITHVDSNKISGWHHRQVIKLLLKQQTQSPSIVKKKSLDISEPIKTDRVYDPHGSPKGGISGRGLQGRAEDDARLAGLSKDQVGPPRTLQKSKSFKSRMLNALRKSGRVEEKSTWYTDGARSNDAEVSSQADCVYDSGNISPTPRPYSVELRIIPTIKIKKAVKPTKKILSLISKKKAVDVLVMPKSFLSFQEKSLNRRSKQQASTSCDGTPVKRYIECLTTPNSPYRTTQTQLRYSRPTTLIWSSRREGQGAAISPLVLCPSSNRSSTDSRKSSQSSPRDRPSNNNSSLASTSSPDCWNLFQVDGQSDRDQTTPRFFISGPELLENSEPPTPTEALD